MVSVSLSAMAGTLEEPLWMAIQAAPVAYTEV